MMQPEGTITNKTDLDEEPVFCDVELNALAKLLDVLLEVDFELKRVEGTLVNAS